MGEFQNICGMLVYNEEWMGLTSVLQVELEKLKLSELSCRDALAAIAKIIYSVHDDVKDKDFELELRCSFCTCGFVQESKL
jgi:hypothetical protein